MFRKPILGVWGHSGAQNGPGRENPIWTCFVTATWQFWTENGVKMHFWSVWGKIKPRNDENTSKWKHVKICLERPFSVVLTHFGTHHSTQASSRGAWARMHTRQHFVILTSFELQNRPRPPRKALSLIFMCFFIIPGLYFAQNRPELHFLCKFSAKNDHFWGIWEILTQKWRKKCISGQFQAK